MPDSSEKDQEKDQNECTDDNRGVSMNPSAELADPGKFWDAIFSANPGLYGERPNDFLAVAAGLMAPGAKVLSLAEGEGRNAAFLARSGCQVTCLDASLVARESARQRFSRDGIHAEYIVDDLNQLFGATQSGGAVAAPIPGGPWDAVVAIWCHLPSALRKKVFAGISEILAPGGLFIMEGYNPDQIHHGTGGPKDLDLLFDPADVRRELNLDFILFQTVVREIHEGPRHDGISATLQIIGRKQ